MHVVEMDTLLQGLIRVSSYVSSNHVGACMQSRRASELGGILEGPGSESGGAVAAGGAPKLAWASSGAGHGGVGKAEQAVSPAAAAAALSGLLLQDTGEQATASCVVGITGSVRQQTAPQQAQQVQEAPAPMGFAGFQVVQPATGAATATASPASAGTPPFPGAASGPVAVADTPTDTDASLTAGAIDAHGGCQQTVGDDDTDAMSVSMASPSQPPSRVPPVHPHAAGAPVTLCSSSSTPCSSSVAGMSGIARALDMDTGAASTDGSAPVSMSCERGIAVPISPAAANGAPAVNKDASAPTSSADGDPHGRLLQLERIVSLAGSLHAMRRWAELGMVLSSVGGAQHMVSAHGSDAAAFKVGGVRTRGHMFMVFLKPDLWNVLP